MDSAFFCPVTCDSRGQNIIQRDLHRISIHYFTYQKRTGRGMKCDDALSISLHGALILPLSSYSFSF